MAELTETPAQLKTSDRNRSSPMKPRPLGRTGIDIAPLVLGGNVFGWTADESTSFSILDRLADAGFNAIDTADAYSTWVPGHQSRLS
jgi:aryl-alcohol dehydrogenase-like predicted oxidoreductase